ncbi:uncharacterized protein L201_002619 [Kwoniella dendrophila CBS 6074]|uniref:Uncharacterized protein n=1 Tax=Kwoniella dendrophila CBS 6074 TaxID=1295534 RepID=A0AAX4JQM3_9TREE
MSMSAVSVPAPSPSRKSSSGLIRSPAGNQLSSAADAGHSKIPVSTSNLISSSSSRQQMQGDYMARTSSAISSSSSSSIQLPYTTSNNNLSYSPNNNHNSPHHHHHQNNHRQHPGIGKRRSTDASSGGGLDYYWSSLAGAGASSSSSSLGISSSPSSSTSPRLTYDNNFLNQNQNSNSNQFGVSPSTINSFERDSRNVGDLRNEEYLGIDSNNFLGSSFEPSSFGSFINNQNSSTDKNRNIREAKSTGNLRNSSNYERDSASFGKQSIDDHNHNMTDEKTPRQPDYPSPTVEQRNPLSLSTTKALNISYPTNSNNNLEAMTNKKEGLSPGGWSENSNYSNNDDISRPESASSSFLAAPRPWSSVNNDSGSGSGGSGDESSESNYSPIGLKLPGKFDFENEMNQIAKKISSSTDIHGSNLDQPQQVHSDPNEWDSRSSMQSTATYRPTKLGVNNNNDDDVQYRTPLATINQHDRPDIQPPKLSLNQSFNSQPQSRNSSPSGSGGISTPKRSPNSRVTGGSVSSGHYTPTSGRLGLGFDISQFTTATATASGSSSPARSFSSNGYDHQSNSAHNSAPAIKSDFTELNNQQYLDQSPEGITKPKPNKRSTLPATTSTSSGAIVEAMLSSTKENLLSPDKYTNRSGAVTPSSDGNGERRGSIPSPNRSPEPPPRSALRQLPNATNIESQLSNASSRRTSSPQSITQNLPTITHTPNSPLPSPDRPDRPRISIQNENKDENDLMTSTMVNLDKPQPKRPDRSPDRQYSPVFPSSATINDLTDMLGGAIDAIGLIDSRETPPPTIGEPSKKEKPINKLTLRLQPAAEVTNSVDSESDRGPMTPNSLPQRGTSLPGTNTNISAIPLSTTSSQNPSQTHITNQHVRRTTQPELRSKASSIFSFGSKEQIQLQSPTLSITVRPWPSAMLYSNIKSLKHSGDRAKGYAKAINELSRSESGLKEWCIASASQISRGGPTKVSALSSLGVRANSVPSAIPLPYQLSPYDQTAPHQRNVSAGSEFPMRADSYTAREISQRIIDPEDQPTSLPSNLPYPQLQTQIQHQGYLGSNIPINSNGSGGGLKPSQSMQSVASFASSTKKGFFSGIGKKSKKESLSLGPPQIQLSSNNSSSSSVNKKDVRGLPISGPRSSSPQKASISGQPPTISGPLGPRGPRSSTNANGSFTPPPMSTTNISRSSIDLASTGGRSSLDTGLSTMATPPKNGPSSGLRGSLDGHTLSQSNTIPPPKSSLSNNVTIGTPTKEEDIRQMSDILPHVEKSVLRKYLARYGETMAAIGAYLEDEKDATVLR